MSDTTITKAATTTTTKAATNVAKAVNRAGVAFAKTEGAFAKNNAQRVSIVGALYRAVGLIGRDGKADTTANDVHNRLWNQINGSVSVGSIERYGLIARLHAQRGVDISPESVAAAYKLYDNDRPAFMSILKGTGDITVAALTESATTAYALKSGESKDSNGGNAPQSIAARVASLGDVLTGSRGIKSEADRKQALAALAALTKRVEGFTLPTAKATTTKAKTTAKATA